MAQQTVLLTSGNHPHPLMLIRNAEAQYICDQCNCAGYGQRYSCKMCSVSLHEACAACPAMTIFFMHKDHPLKLERSHNPLRKDCAVCAQAVHGYHYRCKSCSVQVHTLCAELEETITDSAHPGHPLSYDATSAACSELAAASCDVCRSAARSAECHYRCKKCDMYVHAKCLHSIKRVVSAGFSHRKHVIICNKVIKRVATTGSALAFAL